MLTGDDAYQTATALAAAVANRQISSREVVDRAIARIEALDGVINAVVVRDFDRARQAALAADRRVAKGDRLPLLGVPITVKEQFDVADLGKCWGNPAQRDTRSTTDAVAVSRLKANGAILLGKTNVSFMLADYQCNNAVYGCTGNPWDSARTAGGSSGGSAAALAAGYVSLELGSDLGGSLRLPAHFCGVYALKPSLDIIPLRGGQPPPLPPRPRLGDLATGNWPVAGPMARCAADLALALGLLAAPDELAEGKAYRLKLPAAGQTDLRDFRLLLLDRHPLCPTAGVIGAAMESLADRLERAGARVLRDSDALPDLAETTRIFAQLLSARIAADLPDAALLQIGDAIAALAPDDTSLAALRLRAMQLTQRSFSQISNRCAVLAQRWRLLFDRVDLILCPAAPVTAFAHDTRPFAQRRIDVDGQSVDYGALSVWAAIASLAGLPATMAPIGRDADGLPIGVQIIGGFLEDRTTIAFAGLLERAFGGFVPPRLG